jgi:hypothetical protein
MKDGLMQWAQTKNLPPSFWQAMLEHFKCKLIGSGGGEKTITPCRAAPI